jgi:hypothetical protein
MSFYCDLYTARQLEVDHRATSQTCIRINILELQMPRSRLGFCDQIINADGAF